MGGAENVDSMGEKAVECSNPKKGVTSTKAKETGIDVKAKLIIHDG
jgi:hypothetical protein